MAEPENSASACDDGTGSPPAIRLTGIYKSFANSGESLPVLENINLSVTAGTIVALLGASGSGKSTLLNIISGLIKPDRGQVCLQGAPSSDFNDWQRVSYMFQEDRLLPWRSTIGNIEFALEAGSMAKLERRQRARDVLQLVNLGDFEKAFPYQLSGGHAQPRRAGAQFGHVSRDPADGRTVFASRCTNPRANARGAFAHSPRQADDDRFRNPRR
jgi:NitT/TauT family transport system ATP-binding protein